MGGWEREELAGTEALFVNIYINVRSDCRYHTAARSAPHHPWLLSTPAQQLWVSLSQRRVGAKRWVLVWLLHHPLKHTQKPLMLSLKRYG